METERNQHTYPSSLLTETIPSDKDNVPIVDLSNHDDDLVARAVVKASEEWGVFQVINHGIPMELIQRLKEVGTKFFELPETEKEALSRPADFTDIEGYTTGYKKDEQGRKTWADHLFHRIWPPSRVNYRYWPKNSPDYREVNEEYAKEIKKLSEKIMGWLSEGLGLHRDALKEGLGGETVEYLMKVIFYPPCPKLDLLFGAPPHTDLNGITLLVANQVHGLQAFKDNKWIDVEVNLFVSRGKKLVDSGYVRFWLKHERRLVPDQTCKWTMKNNMHLIFKSITKFALRYVSNSSRLLPTAKAPLFNFQRKVLIFGNVFTFHTQVLHSNLSNGSGST